MIYDIENLNDLYNIDISEEEVVLNLKNDLNIVLSEKDRSVNLNNATINGNGNKINLILYGKKEFLIYRDNLIINNLNINLRFWYIKRKESNEGMRTLFRSKTEGELEVKNSTFKLLEIIGSSDDIDLIISNCRKFYFKGSYICLRGSIENKILLHSFENEGSIFDNCKLELLGSSRFTDNSSLKRGEYSIGLRGFISAYRSMIRVVDSDVILRGGTTTVDVGFYGFNYILGSGVELYNSLLSGSASAVNNRTTICDNITLTQVKDFTVRINGGSFYLFKVENNTNFNEVESINVINNGLERDFNFTYIDFIPPLDDEDEPIYHYNTSINNEGFIYNNELKTEGNDLINSDYEIMISKDLIRKNITDVDIELSVIDSGYWEIVDGVTYPYLKILKNIHGDFELIDLADIEVFTGGPDLIQNIRVYALGGLGTEFLRATDDNLNIVVGEVTGFIPLVSIKHKDASNVHLFVDNEGTIKAFKKSPKDLE